MVFPRYVAEQEDPEIIAERELAALKLNKTEDATRTKGIFLEKEAAATVIKGRDSADGDERRSIDRASLSSISNSSASIDTLASSTAAVGNISKSKEAKAERKKRSRGVSGCSIKKDGGRFEMGFDDLEDYDRDADDDDDCYSNNYYEGKQSSTKISAYHIDFDSEEEAIKEEKEDDGMSSLWQDLIHRALTEQPISLKKHFSEMINGAKIETTFIRRFYEELKIYYKTRLDGPLVSDNMFEYKILKMYMQILDEGIVSQYSIKRHIEIINIIPKNYIDHHLEIISTALKCWENKKHNGNFKELNSVPPEGAQLAKEISQEHNMMEVGNLVYHLMPCFRADFVFELFHNAIEGMSINQVYYAVQSVENLYEMNILSRDSIVIGIRRLVREVPDMEKDLPAATSLVHLLFSYAVSLLPVTDDDKEDLRPPKHMLYGSLSVEGHLEVITPPDDVKELTADNFIYLHE